MLMKIYYMITKLYYKLGRAEHAAKTRGGKQPERCTYINIVNDVSKFHIYWKKNKKQKN